MFGVASEGHGPRTRRAKSEAQPLPGKRGFTVVEYGSYSKQAGIKDVLGKDSVPDIVLEHEIAKVRLLEDSSYGARKCY
jgi:hypothetical protein